MFVNVFLFVSLGKLMNFQNLLYYWKEILTMFLLTTVIRMLMMGKMCFVLSVKKGSYFDLGGWHILLFSGIKGGLSIVMLHWLNSRVPNFEHFELFVAIVTGVILLSMFVYTIGLMITIKINKKTFEKEISLEKHEDYLE